MRWLAILIPVLVLGMVFGPGVAAPALAEGNPGEDPPTVPGPPQGQPPGERSLNTMFTRVLNRLRDFTEGKITPLLTKLLQIIPFALLAGQPALRQRATALQGTVSAPLRIRRQT